jgi:hypothetical protein
MKTRGTVQCLWRNPATAQGYLTGVSLHSHTSHSREYLDFIPRVMRRVPPADRFRRWLETRHSERPDRGVRYRDAFWRPPLNPRAAYDLEAEQIQKLGAAPLVSITDHDDLEACADLNMLGVAVPYSLEWSVPFHQTMFHIGVHNLPPAQAREYAAGMARATANPTHTLVAEMLAALVALPNVLVVLNHPYSNEERVDRPAHVEFLKQFLKLYLGWLHAIELNGLQPATDNRECIELADSLGLPVISGGDRHCREPNANLNLTNASTFAEFVNEIRRDQVSNVLFMPQYRDPIPVRYIELIWHAVQNYPDFAGRERWVDRVFYTPELGGPLLPVSQIWPHGGPKPVGWFIRSIEFLAQPRMRGTLRRALGQQAEITV